MWRSTSSAHSFTVQSDIVYGQRNVNSGDTSDDYALDLYVPNRRSGQRPLIVMIHGGGFAIGSKTDAPVVAYAEKYAEQGWLVASIDYRLASDDPIASARVEPLWDRIGGSRASPEVRAFAASVDDVLTALDFPQMRADVDSQRTVLWGTSAGAQTALVTGNVLDDYGFPRPPIAAVIELSGGFYGMNVGNPFDDATGADPALFVAHGTSDSAAPFRLATDIETWAAESGLPLEYHPIEGGEHFVDMLNIEVSPGASLHERSVDWLKDVFESR